MALKSRKFFFALKLIWWYSEHIGVRKKIGPPLGPWPWPSSEGHSWNVKNLVFSIPIDLPRYGESGLVSVGIFEDLNYDLVAQCHPMCHAGQLQLFWEQWKRNGTYQIAVKTADANEFPNYWVIGKNSLIWVRFWNFVLISWWFW